MPLLPKKKPQPKPQEEKTTSSLSTKETTSKPSVAARIQQAITEYGDNTTEMFEKILLILGMDPDLKKAEAETNEMRSTLEAILAAIEELQKEERERFETLQSMFQEHLDISRGAATAMQTVADALKASQ